MKFQHAAWWFVAPALLVIGVFFFLPVLAALVDEPHRFRYLRAGRPRKSALRRFGAITFACLRTPLFWQALGNTLYFVAVGVPLSIGASLGAALLLNSRARAVQAVLSHRTVRAGRDDAGRRRGHLALPLQYPLRPAELRAGRHRHRSDRLARRPALGHARDHRLRDMEELRLQHDHPARRAAEHSAGPLRGGAH